MKSFLITVNNLSSSTLQVKTCKCLLLSKYGGQRQTEAASLSMHNFRELEAEHSCLLLLCLNTTSTYSCHIVCQLQVVALLIQFSSRKKSHPGALLLFFSDSLTQRFHKMKCPDLELIMLRFYLFLSPPPPPLPELALAFQHASLET